MNTEDRAAEIAGRLRSATRTRSTQRALADELNRRGVATTAGNISNWFSGRHSPSLVAFAETCSVLGVSADAVLGLWAGEETPDEDGPRVAFLRDGQEVGKVFDLHAGGVIEWTTGSAAVWRHIGLDAKAHAGRFVMAPARDIEPEAVGLDLRAVVLVDLDAEVVTDGELGVVWHPDGGRWCLRRVYVEGERLLCVGVPSSVKPYSLTPGGEPVGRIIAGQVVAVTFPV